MEHPEIIVPTKKAKIYMQIEALKWAISQDTVVKISDGECAELRDKLRD